MFELSIQGQSNNGEKIERSAKNFEKLRITVKKLISNEGVMGTVPRVQHCITGRQGFFCADHVKGRTGPGHPWGGRFLPSLRRKKKYEGSHRKKGNYNINAGGKRGIGKGKSAEQN